jgi:hypothetical protein
VQQFQTFFSKSILSIFSLAWVYFFWSEDDSYAREREIYQEGITVSLKNSTQTRLTQKIVHFLLSSIIVKLTLLFIHIRTKRQKLFFCWLQMPTANCNNSTDILLQKIGKINLIFLVETQNRLALDFKYAKYR